MGIAVIVIDDKSVKIGFPIHDGLRVVEGYTCLSSLSDGNNMRDMNREITIHTIVALSKSFGAKFVAAVNSLGLDEMCPGLSAYVWRRLDVVCVLSEEQARAAGACDDIVIYLGEKAHSAAGECVSCFGPDNNPARTIGFRNQVLPNAEGAIQLVDGMRDYEYTFQKHTWVANPEERFDADKQALINEWIRSIAERYWLTPGGPLAPGGADVVVIDDPQMPSLLPLIKKARPEVKIIYRSHIEVRKDLVELVGSPQEQIWQWIWDFVKEADVFISHPVDKSVPHSVPFNTLGLMPARTDRLDGLNKPSRKWDLKFYHGNFGVLCNEQKANHLVYPAREYITQIARFDRSNGIPDVVESYRQLCDRITRDAPEMLPPQLLICGHVALDDPDAELLFAETTELLYNSRYYAIAKDVVVVKIGPVWKALITKAKIVLQLSLREGFEVKVPHALRHGTPVVAMRAGGSSLQIEHGKSGFLVDARMSKHAKANVSDEVGTVGNAACWFYLTYYLARDTGLEPGGRCLMDMAMEEAGQKCEMGQPILPGNGLDSKAKGQR
ncbi:hypothetical protein HOY82DRAFT_634149 [Tuber indicum]|nr:hypothetical protein HOY82DRAFT_634149 [Tuber indicum]